MVTGQTSVTGWIWKALERLVFEGVVCNGGGIGVGGHLIFIYILFLYFLCGVGEKGGRKKEETGRQTDRDKDTEPDLSFKIKTQFPTS